jgi:hypothetical protein
MTERQAVRLKSWKQIPRMFEWEANINPWNLWKRKINFLLPISYFLYAIEPKVYPNKSKVMFCYFSFLQIEHVILLSNIQNQFIFRKRIIPSYLSSHENVRKVAIDSKWSQLVLKFHQYHRKISSVGGCMWVPKCFISFLFFWLFFFCLKYGLNWEWLVWFFR